MRQDRFRAPSEFGKQCFKESKSKRFMKEYGNHVIAKPILRTARSSVRTGPLSYAFGLFGVTCFIFYNQFKDLFTANLQIGLPLITSKTSSLAFHFRSRYSECPRLCLHLVLESKSRTHGD